MVSRRREFQSAADRLSVVMVLVVGLWSLGVGAQSGTGSIRGTVVDTLAAGVPSTVSLFRDGQSVSETQTDAGGAFAFEMLSAGRYRVEAEAPGFSSQSSPVVFVGASSEVVTDLVLQIGPLTQYVVVTAAAVDLPQSRVGSPVTVIDRGTLDHLAKPDVLESLRIVPGIQVVQTGQRGGTTSVFVRGGAADFNKVLIDGVPVNDIGGAADWDSLSTAAVDRVEVLRTSNSVLYGSDALGGVFSLSTPRGTSRRPELKYSVDGGNLGTVRNELSVGGAVDRIDYFVDVSRFDTDNDVPNNSFRNDTLAGRFGVALGSTTDLSLTVRRVDTDYESPNAINFYGVADDSSQTNELTYVSLSAVSQVSDRLQTTVRFGSVDRAVQFVNPTPTGEPFDPFGFGANYLGDQVTITGANGFSTSGRAILDFGGVYPSVFDIDTSRRMLSGQVDYQVSSNFDISGAIRVEREEGTSGSTASTERTNVGSFVEARGMVLDRVYLIGGLGFEDNGLFGYATTPRLSASIFLREPSSTAAFGETKLTFNAGKGIKAPSVFDEQSSLFAVLSGLPNGDELIDQNNVSPIGPERSRNLDIGVEQAFWGGRGRARISYFDNDFSDLVEFLSSAQLPSVGVPPPVASALLFGATVNTSSYRARGLETSAELALGSAVTVSASYTYLDAEVSESFSAGTINNAFPGILIGQFSPLVGARPFRRPTNTGTLFATYARQAVQVSLAGYFVGKQDDSTFLSDAFFGSSLLLPNHDLTDGYQKVDLSGSYRLHSRLRWHVTIENLLDQKYDAAAGFPALPLTFRTGLTVTLGGDDAGAP